MGEIKRIAVTGAGGQIAYSLLFRLAHGDLFGPKQPIALHLLEVPAMASSLEGVVMELEDAAFPLLHEIRFGSNPHLLFEGVEVAFLVGAKPRSAGMERSDLLQQNAEIFAIQGAALNASAARNVQVLVVGNPCNTNALIALHHAKELSPHQFHAMLRLDENRAKALLAKKSGLPVTAVTQMAVWGNHSATQVPDPVHAKIQGRPAYDVIRDAAFLEGPFLTTVQQRGAAILEKRGKSSAASAASAALDAMRALFVQTPENEWFSTGCFSTGNPYGVEEGLVYGFPCRSRGRGDASIVSGLTWENPFWKGKLLLTEQELKEERDAVRHLLR